MSASKNLVELLLSCPCPIHNEVDEQIINGIKSGECKVLDVSTSLGNFVLCYEIQNDVFMIIALKAVGKTKDGFLKLVMDFSTKLAKQNNCKQLKFHTFRPGLVKASIELGFLPCEYILRKSI